MKKEISKKTTVKKSAKIAKKPVLKPEKSSAVKGKKETVKKSAKAVKAASVKKASVPKKLTAAGKSARTVKSVPEKKAVPKTGGVKRAANITSKPEAKKITVPVETVEPETIEHQDSNINQQTGHRRPLIVFPK